MGASRYAGAATVRRIELRLLSMADEPRTGISAWRNELTAAWWTFAESEEEIERAPAFLRPLLTGEQKRVRATPEQIDEALAWAAELPGWEPAGDLKPLHVYDPDA
jgi:hypothetical protein